MRIVNWNIEWMNNWFVDGDDVHFRAVHPASRISDVDALCSRVASVIQILNPDVLTIEEGPSDIRMMQIFVAEYLGENSFQIIEEGGVKGSGGGAKGNRSGSGIKEEQQKIYALVKTEGQFRDVTVADDDLTLELREPWEAVVEGGGGLHAMSFSRPPLVLQGKIDGTDRVFRILTIHTKKKFAHNGQKMFHNAATREYFIEETLANQKRMVWEASRLRKYLSDLLELDPGSEIVVTGDLNDGPGTDYFGARFQIRNVVDILMGSVLHPEFLFNHVLINTVAPELCYTAVFNDTIDRVQSRKLLLDHILVSPALRGRVAHAEIAHEEYEAATDQNAQGRQRHVSDHRPVLVEIS
jgi:hypothetical protein